MSAITPEQEDSLLLSAALTLGERLLECGGEISRVEDTIRRICVSYGAERTDVFAITASIVVTMERNGRLTTQTRRISSGQTDFSRLEVLNDLSRRVCAEHWPIPTLARHLQEAPQNADVHPGLQIAGYALASAAFALFFGGVIADGLCSAVIGLIVAVLDKHLRPLCRSNLLYLLICSILSGVLAILCSRIFPVVHTDKIMIGDIMLFIPGIALTNSLRDLFMGDTISGLLRLMETLLQAGSIACGFAVSIWMGGLL